MLNRPPFDKVLLIVAEACHELVEWGSGRTFKPCLASGKVFIVVRNRLTDIVIPVGMLVGQSSSE
jgi:hypothetical protein